MLNCLPLGSGQTRGIHTSGIVDSFSASTPRTAARSVGVAARIVGWVSISEAYDSTNVPSDGRPVSVANPGGDAGPWVAQIGRSSCQIWGGLPMRHLAG